jgi:hypothetical protein
MIDSRGNFSRGSSQRRPLAAGEGSPPAARSRLGDSSPPEATGPCSGGYSYKKGPWLHFGPCCTCDTKLSRRSPGEATGPGKFRARSDEPRRRRCSIKSALQNHLRRLGPSVPMYHLHRTSISILPAPLREKTISESRFLAPKVSSSKTGHTFLLRPD